MDFKTTILIEREAFALNYSDKILSMGSCFSEYLTNYLKHNGFSAMQNPFGVLYNPMSIVKALERLSCGPDYEESELFEYGGLYGSFAHHTSFSGPDKKQVLKQIQDAFSKASSFMKQADCLLLTFGTAWVYSLATTGKIVANCHKMPTDLFVRRQLSVDEIVDYYTEFFQNLFENKPNMKVLMTVSPIRHFKDGAHENTLSKAVLHLAIDELTLRFPQIHYFPAYEILLDELRDYRFYAEDMMHPSSTALRYIWERFSEYAFDSSVREGIRQMEQIRKAMEHRPFRSNDEAYLRFIKKNIASLEMLQARYPDMDLKEPRTFFNQVIENASSTIKSESFKKLQQ